jgi:hypothetical protein
MLNQDWFAQLWRDAGHEVVTAGLKGHLDYKIKTPLLHVDAIASECGLSGPADLIIYHDDSMPLAVIGLESTSAFTVFYSVDAHHHVHWHKYLAAVCDLTLVAHKDYVSEFKAAGAEAVWFPLWATQKIEPTKDKQFDALFVGTLDSKLNPKRVEFFKRLQGIAPVQVKQGAWWTLYQHAKIVLNQTVKGDLNFRVFEAMASGSLLLTERTPNGLFDLFEEGKHFICYTPGDEKEAARQIEYYLNNSEERERIAAAGYTEIISKHQESHRAQEILSLVSNLKKQISPNKNLACIVPYVYCGWRYETVSGAHAILCFAGAISAIERAIELNERATDHHILYAILACSEYDRLVSEKRGYDVLTRLYRHSPESQILRLALARASLNCGKSDFAAEVVRDLPMTSGEAFELAEVVVREIYTIKSGRGSSISA